MGGKNKEEVDEVANSPLLQLTKSVLRTQLKNIEKTLEGFIGAGFKLNRDKVTRVSAEVDKLTGNASDAYDLKMTGDDKKKWISKIDNVGNRKTIICDIVSANYNNDISTLNKIFEDGVTIANNIFQMSLNSLKDEMNKVTMLAEYNLGLESIHTQIVKKVTDNTQELKETDSELNISCNNINEIIKKPKLLTEEDIFGESTDSNKLDLYAFNPPSHCNTTTIFPHNSL